MVPILQNKMRVIIAVVFKKNLNAAKAPEQSKGLGGNIIGCTRLDLLSNWRLRRLSLHLPIDIVLNILAVVRAGVLEYPPDRQGYNRLPPKLLAEK